MQDKRTKYYAAEYKKANNTILEYIEENKRLKNESDMAKIGKFSTAACA